MHIFIIDIHKKLKIRKIETFAEEKFIRNLSKHAYEFCEVRLAVRDSLFTQVN